jgi:uncharacterized membrane protein
VSIGPVQLLAIGFRHPDFKGEILEEIERLRESDTVRLIDSLTVYKDAQGEVAAVRVENLTPEEEVELGSTVAALIGLGLGGTEGAEAGAELGAEVAARDGIQVFSDEDAWDVMAAIPNDSAAAILLIEHHWAVPLRDAIARAGGTRLTEGFIDPLDLVEIGLLTAEEAEAHAALEPEAAAPTA